MNQFFALFAPLALLGSGIDAGVVAGSANAPDRPLPDSPALQVRIEQRFSVRIAPSAPMMPPQMLTELQADDEDDAPHPGGHCVPVGAIAGVRAGERNRLLLFMRDERIISASLEKACRAADFYMGFYIDHNPDGQICVNRDHLQSRSGSNCRIRHLQLLSGTGRR